MTGRQQGQILYLGGSSSQSGPGGSLSTRFQKLSQARSSGIVVINQPQPGAPVAGRELGLGIRTGSQPTGPRNQSITATNAGRGRGSGAGPGLHTAGGLARAMQERGGGVTDRFLFDPELVARGGGADRGVSRRRVAGAGPVQQNTQAGRHKALVLGNRLGKKQQVGAPSHQQQEARYASKPARRVAATAATSGAGANGSARGQQQRPSKQKPGAQQKADAGKKKGKTNKATPANSASLDTELNEYMMKSEHTAASLLDNDLDSYMADKPEDSEW